MRQYVPDKKCEHSRRKDRCRDCSPKNFCHHDRLINACKDCDGSWFCHHKIRKTRCRECGGSAYCCHDRRKSDCHECHGSAICPHDKRKDACHACYGNMFCKHDIWKSYCKTCGGGALCISDFCETSARKNHHEGYCLQCYIQNFPDAIIVKNYKTKEKSVTDFVKQQFSMYIWRCDKKVTNGFSKHRPDMLGDFNEYIIIIEIDEHKHQSYDNISEKKRLMKISEDLNHRPIVFIRFNPDAYKLNGKTISSCWGYNDNYIMVVKADKLDEWNKRLNTLKDEIFYWSTHKPEQMIHIVHLFYDDVDEKEDLIEQDQQNCSQIEPNKLTFKKRVIKDDVNKKQEDLIEQSKDQQNYSQIEPNKLTFKKLVIKDNVSIELNIQDNDVSIENPTKIRDYVSIEEPKMQDYYGSIEEFNIQDISEETNINNYILLKEIISLNNLSINDVLMESPKLKDK